MPINIRTANASVIEIAADPTLPMVRLLVRRAGTREAGCQALLDIDQASELAAVLANLVDAAKRGH